MRDPYEMNGHKLHWHLDRVQDWMKGEPIAPLYIDMGITMTCNIDCKYCYYAVPENKSADRIPIDALTRFLNDAAEIGVRAIGFLGDGEPTLHPQVYEAVEAGKAAGLDMAIATNGVRLKPERLPGFLDSLTWIRFTLSVAESERYHKVMGGTEKTFEKVVENIRHCVDIKRRDGLETTLGIQMVLIDECIDQVVPLARLGGELGVDYVVVKQCSQKENIFQENRLDSYDEFEPIYQEAESHSRDDYQVIVKRLKMGKARRNYDCCHGTQFLPQITGRGDVFCCGNFFGDKRFYIGSIVEQSFKDIVFGERYREVMDMVRDSVNVHMQCGIGCRQNEINEFLWDLKNPPGHVNFV